MSRVLLRPRGRANFAQRWGAGWEMVFSAGQTYLFWVAEHMALRTSDALLQQALLLLNDQ